jgi:hypothetical protein
LSNSGPATEAASIWTTTGTYQGMIPLRERPPGQSPGRRDRRSACLVLSEHTKRCGDAQPRLPRATRGAQVHQRGHPFTPRPRGQPRQRPTPRRSDGLCAGPLSRSSRLLGSHSAGQTPRERWPRLKARDQTIGALSAAGEGAHRDGPSPDRIEYTTARRYERGASVCSPPMPPPPIRVAPRGSAPA